MKSNIEELIQKLQQVVNQAEALDFSAPLVAGLNAAMGEMKHRVFNEGVDSQNIAFGKYVGHKTRFTNRKFKAKKYGDKENEKDKGKKRKRLAKNGDPEETYTEYEKKRLAHGRQVNKKDLEMFGSLRRGIVVAKVSETKAAVVIPNAKLYLIAQGQNKQISKIVGQDVKIFSFSPEERETMSTTTKELIQQIYAGLFNT